jgi:hypothetical protein
VAEDVRLQLEARDVYGKRIREKLDIFLRHRGTGEVIKANADASSLIQISGLRGAPYGLYHLEVHPPSYQYVSKFINLKASGVTSLTVTFPVDPTKIKNVSFPPYTNLSSEARSVLERSDNVLSFVGKKGKDLYDSLDDIRRAGLLNLVAKMGTTVLTNNRSVLSYIQELRELRGDRFYATVSKDLREETKNSVSEDLFHQVSGMLHHPPSGFAPAGSFKTLDHYANLHLTFFMNLDVWVADIDIDDAGGLEHAFQVSRYKVSGTPTHPYNIHEILVGHQQLDPGYMLIV